MKIYSFLALLFFAVISMSSHAQDTRKHSSNTNTWLMYFGSHSLSTRWGLHAEVQIRRSDFFAERQQLLIRTGAEYYLKNNSRVTVGYAFIKTDPYGEFPVANAFPEHRLWQQFQTVHTIGKIKLSHRYRLEQRNIGNPATGNMSAGRYENRARYMAKLIIPITPHSNNPVFVSVYDEVFVNFGKAVAYNIFDQNRAYAAIGFTLSPTLKIEAGYLHQLIQLRSLDLQPQPKNKIENNHTLQLGVYSSLPFVKQ